MANPPQTAANGEKPQRRGEVHLTTKSMYGHRPLNGLPPDVPSWGTMLSREGRQYIEMAPRLAMWPGVALTLVVYCLNMVGNAPRDLLDPRLRCRGGAVARWPVGWVRAPPSAPARRRRLPQIRVPRCLTDW